MHIGAYLPYPQMLVAMKLIGSAVGVAVAVCVDVYYILYNIITTAHTRMIYPHCDMYFQR